jgi:hypothetical protein
MAARLNEAGEELALESLFDFISTALNGEANETIASKPTGA